VKLTALCLLISLCFIGGSAISSRDLLRRQHSDAEQKEKPYSHGLEQVRKTVRELRAAGRSIMMKDNPLARSTALQKRAVQLMHSLERKAPKRLRIGLPSCPSFPWCDSIPMPPPTNMPPSDVPLPFLNVPGESAAGSSSRANSGEGSQAANAGAATTAAAESAGPPAGNEAAAGFL
jgi:hypothetical protein